MASGHRAYVKRRSGWLYLIFALLYLALSCRLLSVQVLENERYHTWAGKIRSRKLVIAATRGRILDRNGQVLATSIESASIYANTNEVKDPEATAIRVAALIGERPQTIEDAINGSRTSIAWIGQQLDPRIGDKIAAMRSKLPGIGVERDSKRVYPAGDLASQIIGFTNTKSKGLEGLEAVMDGVLSGRDGAIVAELDAERRVIPETRRELRQPEDGKDVYLTIDAGIQHIAEQALERMAETYKPADACALVLDPKTGEILALANYPTFDPNKPRGKDSRLWRNRAVADLYEPGSTLKLVTVAAALNEGISPYEVVARCTGCETIKGGKIRCSLHHPYECGHGSVDMYKTIQQSCNIAAAHLAFRMGAKKLYDYEKAFGLLERTQAGFGCETAGMTLPYDEWQQMRLANVGFGQGIAVTPLQMAAVYAAIANGGTYLTPKIVREVRNADGTLQQAFRPDRGRRVVSKAAAQSAARMLATCVETGTGKTAAIDGRRVAGKTGSAQIAKPKGGYESGAFIASFIGFAPVTNPRIVIAVVVKRPKGSHWGATVAAPVFREIGEKTLWYLKVPSSGPDGGRENKREDGRKGLA